MKLQHLKPPLRKNRKKRRRKAVAQERFNALHRVALRKNWPVSPLSGHFQARYWHLWHRLYREQFKGETK